MIELLTTNHMDKILDLFEGSQKEIKIISPFLTMSMAEKLCEVVKNKGIPCSFITRFYLEDMIVKANSIDALELMIDSGIDVYAVKKLHTKLYLFDSDNAVMGSANFTNGGFKSNIELSLLLSDEQSITSELHSYFDDMVSQLKSVPEGLVSKEIIAEARGIYERLFSAKKTKNVNVSSIKMYGATLNKKDTFRSTQEVMDELDVCRQENDIICDMFKETEKVEQKKYPFNIWLKFDGEGDARLNANEGFPMTSVTINGGTVYLSNYPFKVGSVKENDEVYLAALTTDKLGKNQPVIVGRGTLGKFSDSNYADDVMISKYDWMDRYPWYVPILDCEVIDTSVDNGIPMDSVWDALGSDTYLSSYGKNEDIAAVSRKHYQKAHMRLSGNAKDYLDKRLDELIAQYGVIKYKSEI